MSSNTTVDGVPPSPRVAKNAVEGTPPSIHVPVAPLVPPSIMIEKTVVPGAPPSKVAEKVLVGVPPSISDEKSIISIAMDTIGVISSRVNINISVDSMSRSEEIVIDRLETLLSTTKLPVKLAPLISVESTPVMVYGITVPLAILLVIKLTVIV